MEEIIYLEPTNGSLHSSTLSERNVGERSEPYILKSKYDELEGENERLREGLGSIAKILEPLTFGENPEKNRINHCWASAIKYLKENNK